MEKLDCAHGSSPPNFRGNLKIPDQNNWEGPEQEIKFGKAKFKGGPKILWEGGGGYEHSW